MAVTYDSQQSSTTGNNVSSVSWSHTSGSGSDRAIVVGVKFADSFGATLGTITVDGNTATEANDVDFGAVVGGQAVYAGSTTGSITIVVNFDTANATQIGAGAASYAGVDQTTPIRSGTAANSSGSSSTPSLTVSSQADDMVVDLCFSGQNSTGLTSGSGQTTTWGPVHARQVASSHEAGAASVSMDWTYDATENWNMTGFALAAAAAAGEAYVGPRRLGTDRHVRM